MISLSEGALDAIISGQTIDNPIFQILGHKKMSSTSSGERYRLLVSDGAKINSFTMLATQLNHMIDTELVDFTIVQITRYALSNVNNAGKPKKVLVILGVEVKQSGESVGGKIGNPTQLDQSDQPEATPNRPVQNKPEPVKAANVVQKKNLNDTVSAGSNITTTPIAGLSPYQNRWVIKARVSNKSSIRTWSNSRGEGKLFSLDLVDESGEIRCTAFKEQCDKFYETIEIGKVYYISRCSLKPANKQYSSLNNDYEMSMNNDTEIIACLDDVDEIPAISYNFKPLSEVETLERNDVIDVLAIVKSYDEVQTLTARSTGRELKKRDVQLVDQSKTQVTLTLWGSEAENFNVEDNPVLAAKGVRIGEFQGGKNLSTVSSSMLILDPDLQEAHSVRGWWNRTGKNEECKVLQRSGGGGLNGPLLTISEGTQKSLELSDGSETFVIKGCISLIRKDNALYKSCPNEICKKKLVDQDNEMFKCEKCEREYPNFKYRMLTNLSITDWSGNQWATAFSEETEKIIGMTAQELGELKETDIETYDGIFAKALFQNHFFKIRSKKETYNDETRVKSVVVATGPVNRQMYHTHMMQEIKRIANVQTE